jgi:hypothetical protein
MINDLKCLVTSILGIPALGSVSMLVDAAAIITRFSALPLAVIPLNGSATLMPVFVNGTGMINHGIGNVSSGGIQRKVFRVS